MYDYIQKLHPKAANAYLRLSDEGKEIAKTGIQRHRAACAHLGCGIDRSALFEIVNDAGNGRAVYAEQDGTSEGIQNCSSLMVDNKRTRFRGAKAL